MGEKRILWRKRAGQSLLTAAIVISCFLPICFIAALAADCRLGLFCYAVVLWTVFLLTVGAAFLLWGVASFSYKGIGRMATALLPVSLLNGALSSLCERNPITYLGAGACLAGAILLFVRFARVSRLAWVWGALTAVAVVLVLMITPGVLLLSLLTGERTTLRRIESPERIYVAQVVSDDQGALGGNTLVEVYRVKRTVNLFFIQLTDSPRRIYSGDFGESGSITVAWRDGQTLLINGEVFPVE